MIKFEDYKKMIVQRANYVSKKYKYDYEECLSIGYEIYVNAVKKYDVSKGVKFGTYLYIELNRIVDEVERQIKISNYVRFSDCVLDENFNVEDLIESERYELDDSDLFELAKKSLSYEAFRLLMWISSFEWKECDSTKILNVPSKRMASKGCGFPMTVVNSAWAECKSFWNKVNVA